VLTSSLLAVAALVLRAPQPHPTSWFDIQEGTAAARYRYIETSDGLRTNNQLQDRIAFRASVKPPTTDVISLDVGAFSGGSLTSSWNNTGIGTGDRAFTLSVKQLYATVRPWTGVEVQVGSLYAVRGESTEITDYDNDVYLTGERVAVRMPRRLWLDGIVFTAAYIGDVSTPNVFRRLDRLSDVNLLQLLVYKSIANGVVASAEWSQPPEGDMLRAAIRLQPAQLHGLRMRVEGGWRPDDDASSFAVTAEHAIGARTLVGGGYANVDQRLPPLNGDRYGEGRRVFVQGTVAVTKTLAASAFFTQSFSTPFRVVNARRFDAVLIFDVLGAIRGVTDHPATSTTR